MGARPCSRFSRIGAHVIPGAARGGSSPPRPTRGRVLRSLQIADDLARRPAVRAAAVALLALGALSGSLPLLEAPGYELGQVGALAAVLLAPFAGLAAVRLERAREAPSALAAWGGASAVTAALAG